MLLYPPSPAHQNILERIEQVRFERNDIYAELSPRAKIETIGTFNKLEITGVQKQIKFALNETAALLLGYNLTNII